MAQFDLFRDKVRGQLVVDCQSDLLRHLPTRLVIPLLHPDEAPAPVQRLNPTFEVGGEAMILVPQYAASVALATLQAVDIDLRPAGSTIIDAIDFLVVGF